MSRTNQKYRPYKNPYNCKDHCGDTPYDPSRCDKCMDDNIDRCDTNADCIRRMNDEQLSVFLANITSKDDPPNITKWRDWLNTSPRDKEKKERSHIEPQQRYTRHAK